MAPAGPGRDWDTLEDFDFRTIWYGCVCVGGGGGGREWGSVVTNGSEHCQLFMPALSVTSRRYDYFN